jgi:hypothetical protein
MVQLTPSVLSNPPRPIHTNHIYSIVGLQDYDKGLFEKLANLPAQAMK